MVKLQKNVSQRFRSLIPFVTSVSVHLATVTIVLAQNNAGLKLNTADVSDRITIRTNVPLRLNVTCRGINTGRDIYINSVTSRTFSRSRKHYQTFSVCCKFYRNGQHIPNLNRAFDDFYPMGTLTGSGKSAEITIGYPTITIKIGSQTGNVRWGQKTYRVCHQPDIKRPVVSSSPVQRSTQPQAQNQAQNQRPAVARDFNPFVTTDSGSRCVSDCNRKGSSYEWCYVEQLKSTDTWDYCKSRGSSLVQVSTGGIVSSNGVPCGSPCRKDGSDYKCTTFRSWSGSGSSSDYCSPARGYDYRGNRCSGRCEYKNSKYKYCDLVRGSWGYCSQ